MSDGPVTEDGKADTAVEVVASLVEGTCRYECRRTFHGEHGGALPGGPFPGTGGSEGCVRRCQHGRLWRYDMWRSDYRFDEWEPISKWWEPLAYRRANRALTTDSRRS